MNLTLLKDFFNYAGKKQAELEAYRARISEKPNTHSLFLSMFLKPSSTLTVESLVEFMNSFHPQVK